MQFRTQINVCGLQHFYQVNIKINGWFIRVNTRARSRDLGLPLYLCRGAGWSHEPGNYAGNGVTSQNGLYSSKFTKITLGEYRLYLVRDGLCGHGMACVVSREARATSDVAGCQRDGKSGCYRILTACRYSLHWHIPTMRFLKKNE